MAHLNELRSLARYISTYPYEHASTEANTSHMFLSPTVAPTFYFRAPPAEFSIGSSMSSWIPPVSGTPCLLNLPALDVHRGEGVVLFRKVVFVDQLAAKHFYSMVFDWRFQDQTHHPEAYPPDQIAFFNPPSTSCPGGAISKVESTLLRRYDTGSKVSALMYLFVDDLEVFMWKVEAAGGKRLSDVEEEGNTGLMQYFEDSEGNFMGLYMLKPKL